MVGDHGGIQKMKDPMEPCENRLKYPVTPMDVVLDVLFTPIVLVGIKQVERNSVTLGTFFYKTWVVAPDVEAVVELEGVVLLEELMATVGYVQNVMF